MITKPNQDDGYTHCLTAAHNFQVRIRDEDDYGNVSKKFKQYDAVSAKFFPRFTKDKIQYECHVIM